MNRYALLRDIGLPSSLVAILKGAGITRLHDLATASTDDILSIRWLGLRKLAVIQHHMRVELEYMPYVDIVQVPLDWLSESQRSVVDLRDAGYSYADIGRRLRMRPVRAHRLHTQAAATTGKTLRASMVKERRAEA